MRFYCYSSDVFNGYRLCVAQPVADGGREIETDADVVFFWEVLQATSDADLLRIGGEVLPFRPAHADALRLWLLQATPHFVWRFLTEEGEEPDAYDWQYCHVARLDILTALADRDCLATSDHCYHRPAVLTENAVTFYVRENA